MPITDALIAKAIAKMSLGKAAGPSCIIAEMIKTTGETGVNFDPQDQERSRGVYTSQFGYGK